VCALCDSLARTASGVVWVFGDMFGQDQEKALPKPTIMCLHASAIAAGRHSSLVVV
jgi:poly-gamma-glutamate capsule biosynthesis protein CapA/YwtB (metallophosphatase superfamily)